MESESSVILESCGEDSMLIQTVKNIVNENTPNDMVSAEEGYFVVTDVQGEQANVMEVANEESTTNHSEERGTWTDLCRVCANVNDHLIPIFEGEGLQHELCNKIHKYLPIHVSENDTLPLQLCYHCAATLLAWHELSEGCLSAERRLLEMQDSLQEKQYFNTTASNGLEAAMQDVTSVSNAVELLPNQQAVVKDEVCGETVINDSDRFGLPRKKSFAAYCSWQMTTMSANRIIQMNTKRIVPEKINKQNNEENIQSKTHNDKCTDFSDTSNSNSEECNTIGVVRTILTRRNCSKEAVKCTKTRASLKNQHTCKVCKRIFKRECHLMRHASKCKSKKKSNIKVKKPNTKCQTRKDRKDLNKENDKNIEDEESKDWESYKKCKRKRPGTYPCMYCDYTAKRKKLLEVHLTESHAEFLNKKDKKLRCIDREMVMRAKMEVDGKVYYHCNECGKNLYSPYTFFWHVRIHTGERPYTCHLCGKQFRVNQGLIRHLRETHAGIKNFPCDLCGRMFSTKRNAEDHRRTHTGERPYICNVCGKAFKQKASLFVHNRTHSDVFPFKCSYCDQSFRTRPPLMVHITKHTGEKPHACDICGRCFRIKYELKRHRLIHFDDKPWQCTECNLSFRQKRYLVNHRKINHSTNSFVPADK